MDGQTDPSYREKYYLTTLWFNGCGGLLLPAKGFWST